MSIEEAIARLDTLVRMIEEEMPKISEELAITAQSMITRRIQQEGLPGRSYSENPLPAFYFEGRALNAGGRKLLDRENKRLLRDALANQYGETIKLKKNKLADASEPISYKRWRTANGLQTSFVDLTFTGRMFQNIGVVGTERQGNTWSTILGGFTKEVRDKLRYNAIRYGNFFALTPEEKAELEQLFENRLQSLMTRILNA